MAKEREVLKAGHAKEVADAREEERAAVTEEMEQLVRGKLLTFGRFLKAAAARRQDESVEPDEEGRAFEGVLSNVYTGDLSAVDAIEKLIDGSEEKVRDFTGELNVTCEILYCLRRLIDMLTINRCSHQRAQYPRSPRRRRRLLPLPLHQ